MFSPKKKDVMPNGLGLFSKENQSLQLNIFFKIKTIYTAFYLGKACFGTHIRKKEKEKKKM